MAIDIVDIGERGLIASHNLRKREKLLFVPLSPVISADSVWTNGEAGEVMKRDDVPDWPLLAVDDDLMRSRYGVQAVPLSARKSSGVLSVGISPFLQLPHSSGAVVKKIARKIHKWYDSLE
ncbi:hypothetical protein Bca52824_018900 [Brassica carinata]|uniref:Uncharacterized protein n=1 Tax=Brassica carinata TaxID=52824 RepID=A0A8X7VRF2_BRACI|nr:hypothetical protein Bca52824_018900 [Brassica carinata]